MSTLPGDQLSYDEVFTFSNLYNAYKQSRKGVMWKASTQRFKANVLLLIYELYIQLSLRKYKSKGFHEFFVYERGKRRWIRSVHISERIVQRCLCDHCLVPILSKALVYDNSASLPGKGFHFAISRLTEHLSRHYKNHGSEGYILLYDFRKYFDRIRHDDLIKMLDRYIEDKELLNLTAYFIRQFGSIGLGLGSQVSQICALLYPNSVDHMILEELQIQGSARYNDDGYMIHESKEYLQACRVRLQEECAKLGIELHENKTQIVKLSKGFTHLKLRFKLTESGKIIKTLSPKNITRHRRKIKKLKKKQRAGVIARDDLMTSHASWKSYAQKFQSYNTVKRMDEMLHKEGD